MKSIAEIFKSKGITEATRYHNYEYLYKAMVESCDEYASQFHKPDVIGSCFCGDCGKELTMMTYGKYQCNNGGCKSNLR